VARVFITGSSTGLGLLAAQQLARNGHSVVLHARNDDRAKHAAKALPGREAIVVGDIETMAGATAVAEQINQLGACDAVIHNAAVFGGTRRRTTDGLPQTFAVNVLSAYILTALIERPKRLIYLSSSMHLEASGHLNDVVWRKRSWNGTTAYSESKFCILLLAFAVSRLWPGAFSNAVDPGWVPTRMGGPSATDDLHQGYLTQAALAAPKPRSPLYEANRGYFYHMTASKPHPLSHDIKLQDRCLDLCRELSGLSI
jgi:NAD(P)-dependent dehydrogenase (short-subunit alcohol dehydrogenase family)